MLDLDLMVFVGSVVLSVSSWSRWYRDISSVNRFGVRGRSTWLLRTAPLVFLLLIFLVLEFSAAQSVRESLLYTGFYLLLGAAWLGGATLLFPFLGISARDDALERGNDGAALAIVGALAGITFAFAGGNIGNGPGPSAVLISAGLSSALFFALWLALEALCSISDAITIDRSKEAAVRLAGFLAAAGLLGGWSVAGNWTSLSGTLRDFAICLWPAVILTMIALTVEKVAKAKSTRPFGTTMSLVISASYVGVAIVWVAIQGIHS